MSILENEIPSWSNVRTNLHEDIVGHDRLLITVGDSWTWGDSLGGSKARMSADTGSKRLNLTYGRALQSKLNSDWVNIALPGISNATMLNWLELYLPTVTHKQVDIFICLTETGRHEEINIANRQDNSSLVHSLNSVLKLTYQRIDELKNKYSHYNFFTSHNFTDGNDQYTSLPFTWLEIMLGKPIANGTRVVVSEHIEQLCNDKNYADKILIIDLALDRISLLDQCAYTNKEDTRHPTSVGHQLWANYIYDRLFS